MGYNCFVAWPREKYDQVQCLFGLLDTTYIQDPIQRGIKTFPYFPGHFYVAYPGDGQEQVSIFQKGCTKETYFG